MQKENVRTKIQPKDDIINPIIKNMETIFQLKNQHLLTYFRLKPNQNSYSVDVAILSGLLKSLKPKVNVDHNEANQLIHERNEEAKYRAQLRLCLTWNRFDMAQTYILNDEQRDKVCIEDYNLNNNNI